jgi:hypothetical protein
VDSVRASEAIERPRRDLMNIIVDGRDLHDLRSLLRWEAHIYICEQSSLVERRVMSTKVSWSRKRLQASGT